MAYRNQGVLGPLAAFVAERSGGRIAVRWWVGRRARFLTLVRDDPWLTAHGTVEGVPPDPLECDILLDDAHDAGVVPVRPKLDRLTFNQAAARQDTLPIDFDLFPVAWPTILVDWAESPQEAPAEYGSGVTAEFQIRPRGETP